MVKGSGFECKMDKFPIFVQQIFTQRITTLSPTENHASFYIIVCITELGKITIANLCDCIKRPIFVVCRHCNRDHICCERFMFIAMRIARVFRPSLFILLNLEFGELKMEFSSWFVINRRCFVWLCLCVRVLCSLLFKIQNVDNWIIIE